LGYSKPDEMQGWLSHLLKYSLAAITIHARTKQEKSKVPAHWEKIEQAVKLRDELQRERVILSERMTLSKTLIIGNGDIQSRDEALQRIQETGCDGVMLGRAIFGNPWLYAPLRGRASGIERDLPIGPASLHERFSVMVEHTRMFEQLLGDAKSFAVMKKHYKAYVNGFDGAKEFRMRLMEAEDASGVARMVDEWEVANPDVAGKNRTGV
jgi:tRNA-dihydrouridine synthase